MYLRDFLLPLSLFSAHSQSSSKSAETRHQIREEGVRRTDRGPLYGSVRIINSCDYDVYLHSVGAWEAKNNHDGDEILIPAHKSWDEPYRETCPKPKKNEIMEPPPNCPSLNKMEGQAVSLKISREKVGAGPESILQLEYALVENPERHDTFPRLDYDISLLNCAQIENITEIQAGADSSLNEKKIDGCPGYQKGLALWFDKHELCRPIYCDGLSYCDGIYNYQRTVQGEDSFACHKEYYGDMNLELCVGNSDGNALEKYKEWAATGTTIASLPKPTSQPSTTPTSPTTPTPPLTSNTLPSSAPPVSSVSWANSTSFAPLTSSAFLLNSSSSLAPFPEIGTSFTEPRQTSTPTSLSGELTSSFLPSNECIETVTKTTTINSTITIPGHLRVSTRSTDAETTNPITCNEKGCFSLSYIGPALAVETPVVTKAVTVVETKIINITTASVGEENKRLSVTTETGTLTHGHRRRDPHY